MSEAFSGGKGIDDCPYVEITVKNTGRGLACDTGCTVRAKKGNKIVETSRVYFPDFDEDYVIDPGETVIARVHLCKLHSHSDYDELEYDFDPNFCNPL